MKPDQQFIVGKLPNLPGQINFEEFIALWINSKEFIAQTIQVSLILHFVLCVHIATRNVLGLLQILLGCDLGEGYFAKSREIRKS